MPTPNAQSPSNLLLRPSRLSPPFPSKRKDASDFEITAEELAASSLSAQRMQTVSQRNGQGKESQLQDNSCKRIMGAIGAFVGFGISELLDGVATMRLLQNCLDIHIFQLIMKSMKKQWNMRKRILIKPYHTILMLKTNYIARINMNFILMKMIWAMP